MKSRIVVGALLLTAVLAVPGTSSAAGTQDDPLTGALRITAGDCDNGTPGGSWFRMILPTGDQAGPFVSNGDSSCDDTTYTLLTAGSDGGLVLGDYQPQPSPAFDESGHSLAARVFRPTPFFGVNFSASTNSVDPQTGASVPTPSLHVRDGALTGDLSAFAASWNGQDFNQGAPKPDGSSPGNTMLPSGTYDPTTGTFSLEWASHISGGPFDGFTGLWHLEGRLTPDAAGGSPSAPPAADSGAGEQAGDDGSGRPADSTGSAGGDSDAGGAGGTDHSSGGTAPPDVDDTSGSTAPGEATSDVEVSTTSVSAGREPAVWLVALLTVLGLAAVAASVLLDRAARREPHDPSAPDTRRRVLAIERLLQPRVARLGAAALAIVCLLALAVLAWTADDGSAELTERTVSRAPRPSVPADGPAAVPGAVGPGGVGTVTSGTSSGTPTTSTNSTDSAPRDLAPDPRDPPDPRPSPESPEEPPVQTCALGIPPPERSGGFASLVPLVPAFGPFSAEAFAMAPAYRPVVELFGPFLPAFATTLEENEETLAPIVSTLRQLETAGFEGMAPLYGPYRPEVLAAMERIADTLAPHSEQLADSQVGACLVALEDVLASAAET